MEQELSQLRDQTNHYLSKSDCTMFISAEVEPLHDVITCKNEFMKLLWEIIENLKTKLMNRSKL